MPLNVLTKATSYADMQPGQWCMDPEADTRKGANKVATMCPVCKLRTHLNEKHHIDSQGKVTASVMCPRMSCGDGVARCTWHEFVTLQGWDGGVL